MVNEPLDDSGPEKAGMRGVASLSGFQEIISGVGDLTIVIRPGLEAIGRLLLGAVLIAIGLA